MPRERIRVAGKPLEEKIDLFLRELVPGHMTLDNYDVISDFIKKQIDKSWNDSDTVAE